MATLELNEYIESIYLSEILKEKFKILKYYMKIRNKRKRVEKITRFLRQESVKKLFHFPSGGYINIEKVIHELVTCKVRDFSDCIYQYNHYPGADNTNRCNELHLELGNNLSPKELMKFLRNIDIGDITDPQEEVALPHTDEEGFVQEVQEEEEDQVEGEGEIQVEGEGETTKTI